MNAMTCYVCHKSFQLPDGNVSFQCPHCHSSYKVVEFEDSQPTVQVSRQKPALSKKWGMALLILLVPVLLAGLVLAQQGIFNPPPAPDFPIIEETRVIETQETAPTIDINDYPPALTESDEEIPGRMGEWVIGDDGAAGVLVESVEARLSINEQPPDDGIYLIVGVAVQNFSNHENLTYLADDFVLVDIHNNRYKQSGVQYQPPLFSDVLLPGESRAGYLTYVIPPDAYGLVLELLPADKSMHHAAVRVGIGSRPPFSND